MRVSTSAIGAARERSIYRSMRTVDAYGRTTDRASFPMPATVTDEAPSPGSVNKKKNKIKSTADFDILYFILFVSRLWRRAPSRLH